ncbi:hypothetical protein FB45DRAFT_358980 [Roridomyces roridus]|uniref:Uncharacterized protein n=1 Tax=Roridomyces roridus TaxID=1738132 RepID=A0AAD7C8C0_9AGAR|nr:hypothetical protein FB45DRAFT_358980 [Roridomyces roridus]
MSSSNRKRKRHAYSVVDDDNPGPDPALFIQAHEADIIRGPQAKKAAESLETSGNALIQWNPRNLHEPAAFPSDEDDDFAPPPQTVAQSSFWVDRYDARLLLDALPESTAPQSSPPSPSGWSDLPSDSEDTFFFSPDEAEDYRQEKRRRVMDRAREERLKARREEDGEPEEAPEDVWGGSDEEPDEAQTELMKRTAKSIVATANPAQLEMRILANYGGDKRFAFLRGRWKAAWIASKREAEKELQEEEAKRADTAGGLGTLADYGDSDEEGSEEQPQPQDEALVARQERAKAWAESRRAAKSTGI